MDIIINHETWLEASNLVDGVYSPLKGFLAEEDYHSVVNNMRLASGEVWPIPITIDIPLNVAEKLELGKTYNLRLENEDKIVGRICVSSMFNVDYGSDLIKIYGTEDSTHPGVLKEKIRSVHRIGGEVELSIKHPPISPEHAYKPKQTKQIFKERNWSSITGFQTRNPPHRAHEHLQRICMDVTSGLMIQPLIGWKKSGDFTPKAVLAGYEALIKTYYPEKKVLLCSLEIPMRYAGPREAVLHALIRKNFGCTHFIVGRDHAGVGNFYGKYDAQNLCKSLPDIGIEILALAGPYYCKECGHISTENTCAHTESQITQISGTLIRSLLKEFREPPVTMMRREVADALIELSHRNELFV